LLQGWPLVTDEGVLALVASQGARLREIRVDGCTKLVNEAVLAIAARCPLLETVSSPPGTSDAAVLKLAQGCPNLVDVSLVGCSNVAIEGVRAITGSCSNPSQHSRSVTPKRVQPRLM
jgi:EIN3-binding F-box protein